MYSRSYNSSMLKKLEAFLNDASSGHSTPVSVKSRHCNNMEAIKDYLYERFQAPQNQTILLLCADHAGYGDLLFGLRMAGVIKEKFPSISIHFVTSKSGQKKILELNGGIEFGLTDCIYNIEDYLGYINQTYANDAWLDNSAQLEQRDKMVPDLIIEAPVYSLLKPNIQYLPNKNNILLISEYGADANKSFTTISSTQKMQEYFEVNGINIASSIDTGFLEHESGILIDPSLAANSNRLAAWQSVPEPYRSILLQHRQPAAYDQDIELGMGYTAAPYLQGIGIFAELLGNSNKNADLLLLGHASEAYSMLDVNQILKENNFDIFVIHDLDNNETQHIPLNNHQAKHARPERTFRLLHKKTIPHGQLTQLNKVAGCFRIATGDQSMTEACSNPAVAVVAYETLLHKRPFANSIRRLASRFESLAPGISRAVELLTWYPTSGQEPVSISYSQIKELGCLIRNPAIQGALEKMYHLIRTEYNLNHTIIARINRLLWYGFNPSLKQLESELFQQMKYDNVDQVHAAIEMLLGMLNQPKEFHKITSEDYVYRDDGTLEDAVTNNDYYQVLLHLKFDEEGAFLKPYLNENKIQLQHLLELAISSGASLDIIKILLEVGANSEAANAYGLTPIAQAVISQHVDALMFFMEAGANTLTQTPQQHTLLHLAVFKHNAGMLNIILQANAIELINWPDKHGRTPLHYAAIHNDLPTCKMLIQHGADVLRKDKDEKTASMYAKDLLRQYIHRTQMMQEHRASINARYLFKLGLTRKIQSSSFFGQTRSKSDQTTSSVCNSAMMKLPSAPKNDHAISAATIKLDFMSKRSQR